MADGAGHVGGCRVRKREICSGEVILHCIVMNTIPILVQIQIGTTAHC